MNEAARGPTGASRWVLPIAVIIGAFIVGAFLYAAIHESPQEACEKRGGVWYDDPVGGGGLLDTSGREPTHCIGD